MKIKMKMKRFDKELPLPEYKSGGAAAMDLVARIDLTIEPHQVGMMPLNVAMQVPADHWVLLSARSSLFKKGVMLVNGIGVGDQDYCGNDDEYRAALLNFTDQPVILKRGDRLVQMIVLSREQVEITEVLELSEKNRGGFGSTG